MTEPYDVAARLQNFATRLLRQARLLDDGASLTSAQYGALSTLNSQHDLTLTELARLEFVSHPTMSRIVSVLVRQGLVERRSDIADRRSARLSLTRFGRDAYLAVYARRLALIESMLTQLKPETVADLMQALEKLPQIRGA